MEDASRPTFDRLVEELGYRSSTGLVETTGRAPEPSGAREDVLRRLRRVLPDVKAVYFSEEDPLAYFARLQEPDLTRIVDLHRRVWNESRVPLLFVVTPDEVRLYDAQALPARQPAGADEHTRLIKKLDTAASFLKGLHQYRRESLDTGRFAIGQRVHFQQAHRCDATLLANLQHARDKLLAVQSPAQLPEAVVHRLLLRSLLLLHLEHRRVIPADFYASFLRGAGSLKDVLGSPHATYEFFDAIAQRFNGDLLPVTPMERDSVREPHLQLLREFLSGELRMATGQHELWPLYDFSIIPIPVVSSLYKELLYAKEDEAREDEVEKPRRRRSADSRGQQSLALGQDQGGELRDARKMGAFYTRLPLVELVMNEVLPWPSRGTPPLRELPKIIDPACGSGVFLVEAFRRLAAHERARRRARRLSGEVLSRLLTERIFGVDQTSGAVNVAAFSLYLAFLDEYELEAERLWEILRFPKLTVAEGRTRPNLEEGDSFLALSGATAGFDIVVGNPPWRRAKIPVEAASFCQERERPVAQEWAHPFMWLALELLKPQGRAALLCPSKWLTNQEEPDRAFRRAFLAGSEVETVVNLTAMRKGLFAGAQGFSCVTVFHRRADSPSASVLYCTPQYTSHSVPLGLLIDAGDMHWIPRHEAEREDDVWRILQVATWRDVLLMRRLGGIPLEEYIESRERQGWKASRGFQPGTSDSSSVISSIPFVETESIRQLVLEVPANAPSSPHKRFKRKGDEAVYKGPHVLCRKGHSFSDPIASYVEEDCSFQDAVLGIHAPGEQRMALKALAAYLNSSFARYWLFLRGSAVGSNWGYLSKEERLSLPRTPVADPASARRLAALVDEWPGSSPGRREELEHKIDEVIYEVLGVEGEERELVESLLGVHAQRGRHERRFDEPLRRKACTDYATAFLSIFRHLHLRGHWPERAVVRVGEEPLLVVSFYFGQRRGRGGRGRGASGTVDVEGGLGEVLRRLEKGLIERESASIYRRRHMRLFEEGVMHVIKPAEPRFWTRATGYADADALLADAVAHGVGHGTE